MNFSKGLDVEEAELTNYELVTEPRKVKVLWQLD